MKKCKKYMKQNGCVILRGVFSTSETALLDADLRGRGYFSADSPKATGNLVEAYVSREQLRDDHPRNQLQKRLIGVVRRFSSYTNRVENQEDIDADLAALKKLGNSPFNQLWHADDIYQCNIKALCYTSELCAPPKMFDYRKLGGKPIPRSLTKRDLVQEEFRTLVRERFGPVFEAESVPDAAKLYQQRKEEDGKTTGEVHPIREYLEAGDVLLFYGDFIHFGWNNLHTDEDKYFLFVNSSLTGQVDQSFQFHVGEYCNFVGGWTTDAFWGRKKIDLVKRHIAVTGDSDERCSWDKEVCRHGLSVFFHNGHPKPVTEPKDHSRVSRGLHPYYEAEYKTEKEYEAWLEEQTRSVRKAVTDRRRQVLTKNGEENGDDVNKKRGRDKGEEGAATRHKRVKGM